MSKDQQEGRDRLHQAQQWRTYLPQGGPCSTDHGQVHPTPKETLKSIMFASDTP